MASETSATLIVFEGTSGTGKSSISNAVAKSLSSVFLTRYVPSSEDSMGLWYLYELMYYSRAKYEIDDISFGYLQKVFYRQYLHHIVIPAMKQFDVVILDDPNFAYRYFPPCFVEGEFHVTVDMYIVLICDPMEIPERLCNRGDASAYESRIDDFEEGGSAWRSFEWYQERLSEGRDVFGLDTTGRTVDESASIVLAECERRFGWNVTSLRESEESSG